MLQPTSAGAGADEVLIRARVRYAGKAPFFVAMKCDERLDGMTNEQVAAILLDKFTVAHLPEGTSAPEILDVSVGWMSWVPKS